MAYTYDQLFAVDPANPANIARNATITIFAPGDTAMTPLTLTTLDGQPLTNPLTVNANGYASAFMHATLDRVAWSGGGFTGALTSYEGMKQEAIDARAAAETAAADAAAAAQADLEARIAAGDFKGEPGATGANGANGANGSNVLPTDTAIKERIEDPASATRGALNAATLTMAAGRSADQRGRFKTTLTGGGTYHHNSDLKAGTATSATYKTKHPVYATGTRPTLTFANSTDQSIAPTTDPANPQVYTMSASIVAADGVIHRAKVGGSLTWTLAAGQSVTTDPIENLTLVKGTSVHALTYVSTPAANGWRAGYLISNIAVGTDGVGRVYGSDVTATGTGIAGATDNGDFYAFGPTGINGRATVPARSVSIVADSIGFAADSFALKALRNGLLPHVQFSRSGATIDAAGNSPTATQIALAGDLTTDAVLELATNDLSNGLTAAQVQASSLTLATSLRSAGVERVWRTTVTPRSTGAVGAQVAHSSNTHRQAFNTWLRAGAPLDPVTLAAVTVGTTGALLAGQGAHPFAGVLDIAALVEDGTTGTWIAAYHSDGLHPNAAGQTAMEAALRGDLFGGNGTPASTAPTPKNYLSAWFPKKLYTAIAGAQLTNARLYSVPFHVSDAAVQINRLVANCSNAGSAEGLVRTAIYAAGATGRPATLVADLGTKTPLYGATYWDMSPVTLQPGRYFMSIVSEGSPVTPPSYLSCTGADPLVTGDTAWVVPASNAYITSGVAGGSAPATISSTAFTTAAPFMQVQAV